MSWREVLCNSVLMLCSPSPLLTSPSSCSTSPPIQYFDEPERLDVSVDLSRLMLKVSPDVLQVWRSVKV